MEEDLAQLQKELASANAHMSFLMRERDEARAQNGRLRARNREWREAFRQLRDELVTREQTVLALQDEVEVLRSRVPKDTIIPPLAFASWAVVGSQSLEVGVTAGTKHQTILDVVPGRGGMFSLDNGREVRFLSRGRVFGADELATLERDEQA